MKLSDLRYAGVSAWPPAWTSSLPNASFLTGRVDAVLHAVNARGAGVEVQVSIEGTVYRGLLLWDGEPSREGVVRALQRLVGRPFAEAGHTVLRPALRRSA